MKRGPKAAHMAIHEIAKKLGCPVSTIQRNLRTATQKLSLFDDYSLILECLCACVEDPHPILQAGSLECDKDFIALYGDGR